jgi:cytochrome c-type biogenesis protein CcmF
MVTAHVAVTREGKALGEMRPAKWFFRKHEEEPTTEVAIRRGPWEDLYIVMAAFDVQNQAATLHVVVNPLVNWIWMGFGILALGTLIALRPCGVLIRARANPAGGDGITPAVVSADVAGRRRPG